MAGSRTPYDESFFMDQREESRESALAIVPTILSLVHPRSVVDIGCGVGTWLSVFRDHGVMDILGVDGHTVDQDLLFIPEDRFLRHDLSLPLALGRRFELALCLEVAEHLPILTAPALTKTLTELSDVVLFSAAIPGQGGTHHVNEQWPGYWIALFKSLSYSVIDCLRPRIWNNEKVGGCIKQNIHLFASEKGLRLHPALELERQRFSWFPSNVVHPDVFRHVLSRPIGLREILPLATRALRSRITRSFK